MDYRVDERVKKALKKRNVKTKIVTFLKKNFTEESYDLISSWEVLSIYP